MKSKLTFILSLFISMSFGQEYPKMVVDGATWMYKIKDGDINSFFAYHIKGDTTLNGHTYAVLNDQEVVLDSFGVLHLTPNGNPIALMREDTVAKKVYSILLDESILFTDLNAFEESYGPGEFEGEYLLYDFGVEVGNTLNNPLGFTISEITEDEMFGVEVRQFSIPLAEPYYEVFGNERGLFFPHHIYFISAYSINLIQYCVTQEYDCSILVSPSSSEEIATSDFSIFPNPTSDYLQIFNSTDLLQSIFLYALDGRLIHSVEQINARNAVIDLSHINYTGTMLVVSLSQGQSVTKKCIKL